MISTQQFLCCCFVLLLHTSCAFQQLHQQPPSRRLHATRLHEMKRPILDRLATFVFKLENDRVDKASVIDDRGRNGEPMEWAEENSFANKFSTIVASNDIGYRFKQSVADLVAGDYDKASTKESIEDFISSTPVAMYSFTTCPFCRKAKDLLEEQNIPYSAIELDLLDGNKGNEIRAELGKITRRTSVPSIFIDGTYIGGCNDGNPGLLPLARDAERFNSMLKKAGAI
uniref:Glutaredoxin domain-containing protein n=1 Tax=Skeletonema marinoi TaxID=267567 RepID=A0A7S2L2T4_9STRA|mmetsp:Transcript_19883/g.33623  ORF Transcript_19883/g.33623 Transcript_19883/m.33623 type:complete len:228 (+) Transcript_19883:130-813(+)